MIALLLVGGVLAGIAANILWLWLLDREVDQ